MKIMCIATGLAMLTLAEGMTMTIEPEQGSAIVQHSATDYAFSVQAGVMLQSGEARELVFDGNHKLSELVWDISGLMLAGGSASARLGTSFHINAGLWVAINEGNGAMVDYDWFVPGYDWTHFSDGDVEINSASVVDVNCAYTFLTRPSVALYAMAGYRRLLWDWSEYGRSYIYSESGFRDDRGNLYGENGIDYEQRFNIPYAGVGAQLNRGRLSSTIYVLYSPLVQAEDYDHHILRNLKFEETYENIDYIGAGAALKVEINNRWFISFAVDSHLIPEARGDMLIIDPEEDEITEIPGAGGIETSVIAMTLQTGIRL